MLVDEKILRYRLWRWQLYIWASLSFNLVFDQVSMSSVSVHSYFLADLFNPGLFMFLQFLFSPINWYQLISWYMSMSLFSPVPQTSSVWCLKCLLWFCMFWIRGQWVCSFQHQNWIRSQTNAYLVWHLGIGPTSCCHPPQPPIFGHNIPLCVFVYLCICVFVYLCICVIV